MAANNWSGTGINFNGRPSDIKAAIDVLHARNIKVILAVGGATYNNWSQLAAEGHAGGGATINALAQVMQDLGFDGLDVDFEIEGLDAYAGAVKAMRKAVEAITARPQLKRDVFARGDPQATVIVPSDRIDASLYELMAAYVTQRRREERRHYNPGQRVEAFGLEAARDWLRDVLPRLEQWTLLEQVAPARRADDGPTQASFTASTLSASLELVKEGAMDVKQAEAFADLYLKRRGRGHVLELVP